MQIQSCKTWSKDEVFEQISEQLLGQGYCVLDDVLDSDLFTQLIAQAKAQCSQFVKAGVGRNNDFTQDEDVRSDSMQWLEGETECEVAYLAWQDDLRVFLNRRCMLGLFNYEGHFAHYQSGQFYQKHLDAFRGQSNRILSTVFYLNQDWAEDQGGELMVYNEQNDFLAKVSPIANRMVIFLSEEFPHEVLAAKQDRYSIAGWFRANSSQSGRVDPSR